MKRKIILFDKSAAEFICEALDIKGVNPEDVVAIDKERVITKQDGILTLVDFVDREKDDE